MTDLAGRIEEILGHWLEELSESLPDDEHLDDLIDSYSALAHLILEHGLQEGDLGSAPPVEELDRLLARVARANRRADQSISSTLTRFSSLTTAVVSLLSSEGEVPDEGIEVLRAATRVDAALDFSLNRLVRILEESALRARRERANAMTAMMEVLSHELDNRLGAARTATEMLSSSQVELAQEDLERVSRLVRSSLDDALKTVDDVQALVHSWGEEEAEAHSENRITLPVLVRTIVRELEPSADEAGVRLEVASDQVDVCLDAPRLRLILFNLVSNGIKYRDRDKNERWVRIESDRLPDGGVTIRVIDNGIGIAAENHESIFLYRTRVDREIDGTGLGLAIAREAADQLGGELDLESGPGRGSTFTLTLEASALERPTR